MELGQYRLWLCGYGEPGTPLTAITILDVFEAASFAFRLNCAYGLPVRSKRSNLGIRLTETRAWLEQELMSQAAMVGEGENSIGRPVSIWAGSKEQLYWQLVVEVSTNYTYHNTWELQPFFYFGVDLSLAVSSESVQTFVDRCTGVLLRDSRIWYAFINPTTAADVRHPAFYGNTLGGGASWERLVEQEVWSCYNRGPRDRVRGVFWGNLFGPEFASRVRNAGYERHLKWLQSNHPWGPRTVPEPTTGSMAVFLDEKPIEFARMRNGHLTSDDGAVKAGALLWEVLSRAGML